MAPQSTERTEHHVHTPGRFSHTPLQPHHFFFLLWATKSSLGTEREEKKEVNK
jgi:hypothetical protein